MISSLNWVIPSEMLAEETDEKWDNSPKPFNNESFLSWFSRLAKANCADILRLFQTLLEKGKETPCALNQIELNPILGNTLISQLEPFIDIDPTTLKKMFFHHHRKISSKIGWDYLITIQPSPKYCPICLKTDTVPFFRDFWQLPFVTVCPHHKILLFDCCPHCYSPIRYWETSWDKPLTICSKCHQDLTNECMFLRKPQSHDGIKFQDQLLNAYKTSQYQNHPINVRSFFQEIWKLASAESVDPKVKKIDKNYCFLPSERVHKALYLAYNSLQSNNRKLYNSAAWNVINSYPKPLRKVFEELKTASHYFETESRNPPFVDHYNLSKNFFRVFCRLLSEQENLQKAFTTAGGLKSDFGLAWSVFQVRRYYEENYHPPHSRLHPFSSIAYFCEKGAFFNSDISDWSSFLKKALGNRVIYCGINKNFKSKEGFERACEYLKNFHQNHNRIPYAKDSGLKFVNNAVRRGTWAQFGIHTWRDLVQHVFKVK